MIKSFATEFPHLLKEWDFEKNGDLSPYNVPPKGRSVVWWKCKKNHAYRAQISHKAVGKSCPECRTYNNSISVNKPEVLKYWDYQKNNTSPDRVSYGSNQFYYWKCDKGHKFDAPAKSMTRNVGKGCPYCRGLRVDHSNSLASLFPTVAKEWVTCINNPELTPETIAARSHKKVKWKCKRGHEWITSPKHRTSGETGCKHCKNGKRISKQSATLFFYLKQVFTDTILEYPLKGSRMSLDLYIPSQQVAIEYDGGVFHQNTKRDIRKEKWLLEKMPSVKLIRVREPDCGKYTSPNFKVIKYELTDQKTETFARCIEQMFKDVFHINTTINLDGDRVEILKLMEKTEVENSLAELFPELANEWDYKMNSGLTPFQFRYASHEKVYWKCKNNHLWKASIASRSHGGNNCPLCGSRRLSHDNNLAVKYPEVVKEWHPTKNDKGPEKYFPASHFKVWWLCFKCQHEWEAIIYNRTLHNSKCPKCK